MRTTAPRQRAPESASIRGSRRVPLALLALAVPSWLALVSAQAPGADKLLVVGAFSQATAGSLPPGWKPQIFKKQKDAKQTAYAVVRDGETTVLRAVSVGSASGLEHEVAVDLKKYPVLRWRWKVDNVVVSGDPRRKDKDDYAARVYVTFAFEPDKASFGERLRYRTTRVVSSKLPFAAIAYIWASRTPVRTVIPSPHMGGILNLIAVENADARVGEWVEEERNVYDDYRRAFGKEPPLVSGVAVMSDTDNTQERATAYYGDLVFAKE